MSTLVLQDNNVLADKLDHFFFRNHVPGQKYYEHFTLAGNYGSLPIVITDEKGERSIKNNVCDYKLHNVNHTFPDGREEYLEYYQLNTGETFYVLVDETFFTLNELHDKILYLFNLGLMAANPELPEVMDFDVLEKARLRNLFKTFETVNWYSLNTHHFDNLLRFKEKILGMDAYTTNFDNLATNIWLDDKSILLPPNHAISLSFQKEDALAWNSRYKPKLLVTENVTVSWASNDESFGTIVMKPCDEFDGDDFFVNQSTRFMRDQRAFIQAISDEPLDDSIFKTDVSFVKADADYGAVSYLRDYDLVGRLVIDINGDGTIQLNPLAKSDDTKQGCGVYKNKRNSFGNTEYCICFGADINSQKMADAIKHFYLCLGWDIKVSKVNICGPGYNHLGLSIRDIEKAFTQIDVDTKTIMLGEKRTEK